MARPRKSGSAYFPTDCDIFSDRKIKMVIARYGADGFTLYQYALCEIYREGYYIKADEDFYYVASHDLNMSSDKVKQILTFLSERSLFDNKLFRSDAVLTSTGIQKRYQEMVKGRAKKNSIAVQKYWLLNEEETEPYILATHFDSFSENNHSFSENNHSFSENNPLNKRKGKEIKGKGKKGKTCGDLSDLFSLFEHCGFQITGYTAEELPALAEEYSQEWVMEAIKRAADRGKKSMSYVRGILNNWKTAGAMDDVKPAEKPAEKPPAYREYTPDRGDGEASAMPEELREKLHNMF